MEKPNKFLQYKNTSAAFNFLSIPDLKIQTGKLASIAYNEFLVYKFKIPISDSDSIVINNRTDFERFCGIEVTSINGFAQFCVDISFSYHNPLYDEQMQRYNEYLKELKATDPKFADPGYAKALQLELIELRKQVEKLKEFKEYVKEILHMRPYNSANETFEQFENLFKKPQEKE